MRTSVKRPSPPKPSWAATPWLDGPWQITDRGPFLSFFILIFSRVAYVILGAGLVWNIIP